MRLPILVACCLLPSLVWAQAELPSRDFTPMGYNPATNRVMFASHTPYNVDDTPAACPDEWTHYEVELRHGAAPTYSGFSDPDGEQKVAPGFTTRLKKISIQGWKMHVKSAKAGATLFLWKKGGKKVRTPIALPKADVLKLHRMYRVPGTSFLLLELEVVVREEDEEPVREKRLVPVKV